MGDTNIEWTRGDDGSGGKTWNPVDGCSRISEGCLNCYIERTAPMRISGRRFDGAGIGATLPVVLHSNRLDRPLQWRKPQRVFVCSMADLFHDDVPDNFIGSVFDTMALAPQHTFQVLTKRPARARALLTKWQEQAAGEPHAGASFRRHDMLWSEPPVWPLPNVWFGVSAEDQKTANLRIPQLLSIPAAVRWISAEPLIGPVDLHPNWLYGKPGWGAPTPTPPNGLLMAPLENGPRLDWVVVGGETGPGARPMHLNWARSLRDQCTSAGVPFFFKQHGDYVGYAASGSGRSPWADREPDAYVNVNTGTVLDEAAARADGGSFTGVWRVGKKLAGRELDGREWNQFPAGAAV